MRIDAIQNPALKALGETAAPAKVGNVGEGSGNGDFAQTLMDVLKEVNSSQANAKQVQNDFMTGRQSVDYHDLMIAMERASTTMNLTMAVRNKVLEAYQEISHMQV